MSVDSTVLFNAFLTRRVQELEEDLRGVKAENRQLKNVLHVLTTSCAEMAQQVQLVVIENRKLQEKIKTHQHVFTI